MAKKIKPVGNVHYTGVAGQLWKAEIFLNRDNKFYITVPEEIAIYIFAPEENKAIYGDSYEDVVRAGSKVWYDYLLAIVEEEKTIRYFYARSIGGEHIMNRGFSELSKVDVGLGLTYNVGYKIRIGKNWYWCERTYAEHKANPMNKQLERIHVDRNVFERKNDYVYVPWTPKLEEFFGETIKSMEVLINKVDAFFGENPNDLLKSIKNKQKLLT